MPPPWVHRTCLISLLAGLVLIGLGPIAVYQLGSLTAESDAAEAVQASINLWWSRLFWIGPVGGGLLFFGVIGILFLWVTRLASEAPSSAPK